MLHRNPPADAVILAAGLGSRLRPFTDSRPKPLVEVHGVAILHNALRNLAAAGVRRATIVVGYRQEMIRHACGTRFAGLDIEYVPSSEFASTGSAYSLWLARETLLRGDVLLLEGDVYFEPALLARVLSFAGDATAVDAFDATISGSAALMAPDGRVLELRMNQNVATVGTQPLYKTVNIHRFSARTLREIIVPALDELIDAGQRRCYVEQVLSQLVAAGGFELHCAMCDSVRWFEIDNEADLRIAEKIFAPPPEQVMPAVLELAPAAAL